jgi:hypothetical protein
MYDKYTKKQLYEALVLACRDIVIYSKCALTLKQHRDAEARHKEFYLNQAKYEEEVNEKSN